MVKKWNRLQIAEMGFGTLMPHLLRGSGMGHHLPKGPIPHVLTTWTSFCKAALGEGWGRTCDITWQKDVQVVRTWDIGPFGNRCPKGVLGCCGALCFGTITVTFYVKSTIWFDYWSWKFSNLGVFSFDPGLSRSHQFLKIPLQHQSLRCILFLGASKRLYNRLCLSFCWLVGPHIASPQESSRLVWVSRV
jgi:hypothetical protein